MKKVIYSLLFAFALITFIACNKEDKRSKEETKIENSIDNAADKVANTVENAAEEVSRALENLSDDAKAKLSELDKGFFGTYAATIPGIDNKAYETALQINSDLSYTWKQNIVGIEDIVTEEGRIKDINGDWILTLTSNSGDTKLFKILDGGKNLLKLNDDGTEPTKEVRELFIFKRK